MTEIKELVLKVPGLSPTEGRQLGEDVAQRVAARLPEGTKDRYIGDLNVQLSFEPNMGRRVGFHSQPAGFLEVLKLAQY